MMQIPLSPETEQSPIPTPEQSWEAREIRETVTLSNTTSPASPQPRSNLVQAYELSPWIAANRTEPWVIVLINFFVPGVGHILLGQVEKGLAIFLYFWLLYFATFFLSFIIIGILLWPILVAYWVLQMMDGYKIALRIQRMEPVMMGQCEYRYLTFGLSAIVKSSPVFYPGKEPLEYKAHMTSIAGVGEAETV